MRVVINQQSTRGNRTGVGHYTAELMRALRGFSEFAEIKSKPQEFVSGLRGIWAKKVASNASKSWVKRRVVANFGPAGRVLLRASTAWTLRKKNFDLYHEPNFIPLKTKIPTVVTIHDLSVLLHPEWHPADRVAFYDKHFEKSLKSAIHFFTDSETIRQEMVQTLHIPAEQITTTYCGSRAGLSPLPPEIVQTTLERLGLPPRYLLHVGTIEPRKNLLRLMQAYVDLPTPVRESCPLILVGKWGWRTEETERFYEEVAKHRQVRLFGYVDDADLPAIYNGATALVFPTLYEGFGLPPIEMMACGGAVLASTTPTVVEVVGKCAHLIDPENIEGWRDAMQRVIVEPEWREQLRQGTIEQAQPYTWEACARRTLQTYQKLLKTDSLPTIYGFG